MILLNRNQATPLLKFFLMGGMSVPLQVKVKESATFSMICHLPVTLSSSSTTPLSPHLPWLTLTPTSTQLCSSYTDFFAYHLKVFVPAVPSAWNVLHGLSTSSLSSCLSTNVTWGFLWLPYKNSPYNSLSPSLGIFHSSDHNLACYFVVYLLQILLQ